MCFVASTKIELVDSTSLQNLTGFSGRDTTTLDSWKLTFDEELTVSLWHKIK